MKYATPDATPPREPGIPRLIRWLHSVVRDLQHISILLAPRLVPSIQDPQYANRRRQPKYSAILDLLKCRADLGSDAPLDRVESTAFAVNSPYNFLPHCARKGLQPLPAFSTSIEQEWCRPAQRAGRKDLYTTLMVRQIYYFARAALTATISSLTSKLQTIGRKLTQSAIRTLIPVQLSPHASAILHKIIACGSSRCGIMRTCLIADASSAALSDG
ncbi:hypothetical protein NA56DRAFT_695827 [Hyaloscypha hepaticicola]|uniref:Uncharacterized protein n=1 Tax=Hyaloscypha hepaticicola TaxID=2082293 RepID=A0A2J6QP83_9HELO|nr:hypothetical protein NA56DRAFT_695827 [Hyaloscypha hepaticicola]